MTPAHSPTSSTPATIVVGAGVAGLVCAIELHRAGRPVLLLETATDVGGRVRSSHVNGFTVDHGFQVLFTAYPTLNGYLNASAMRYRAFEPAARIVRDGGVAHIGDALREPALLLDTMLARGVPLTDKLRLLALRQFVRQLSIDDCWSARFAGESTRDFLVNRGFSATVIDGFFAPFYGGILLDRSLAASASTLLFTFKMLAEGDTVVPAAGMGAITASLAAQLPPGAVRVGVAVQRIDVEAGRVCGVTLSDASRFEAEHVVIATDAPSARELARSAGVSISEPVGALGCTTVYYASPETAPGAQSPESLLPGKSLWLNASPRAVVSHAVTITDVAPEYDLDRTASRLGARSLLAATAVGADASLPDDQLDTAARRELTAMARAAGTVRDPGDVVRNLTRLAVWRVPFAQFAQPPGWRDQRPTLSCGIPGLWRASETLHSSSLEGAARGGRDAAHAILHPNT